MHVRIQHFLKPGWCWVLALLLAACSQPDPFTSVTEAEAVAFAKKWAATLNKGKGEYAGKLFSRPAFATEMAQYNFYELSKSDIDALAENFPLDRIAAMVAQQQVQGGQYRYIGRFAKEGRQYVRLRQWSPEGLNYHELMLVKENDEVKVADIFSYHTGSMLSAEYMQEARQYEKSGNSRQAQYFAELRQEIILEGISGNAAGVLERYDKLPEQLQRQQRMNYYALLAAIRQGQDTAKAGQLYRLYAANNHTRPDRLLIDVYYASFRRQHAQAMAGIDSIGRLTGDDKWLVFFKAIVSMHCGELDAAGSYLQQSFNNDRQFGANYFYLTQLFALRGRWPEARQMLQRYRSHPEFSGTLESELVAAFPKLEEDE